jgi:hypothetical protein
VPKRDIGNSDSGGSSGKSQKEHPQNKLNGILMDYIKE